MKFFSDYYSKHIKLKDDAKESLFIIYNDVAEAKGFKPEVSSSKEITQSTYDHVAYHVEEFGKKHARFKTVDFLFED